MLNPFAPLIAKVRKTVYSVDTFIAYLKARVAEKSTWAGVIGGFGGASALHHPWDILSACAGVIMVLIPEQNK